ncbi:transcription elongation factor SPT6 homolog [Hibiscus syriacus]|uniref:transcription elongation factor SPT6 homolog n=1 Tax=Hibiscus syriacus TaxID=106335 RepID=UPI001922B085|nr:transcription elongation factor SPT6 homolog [Hibiscus syriacus]
MLSVIHANYLHRWFKINQKKSKQVVTNCSTGLDNEVHMKDGAYQTQNHLKQVQASKVNLDDSTAFEPFFLANKYTIERDDHVGETDIPERMQMIEEITGPPPLDARSIEEEASWILNQIVMNSYILFCNKRTAERYEEVSILLNKIKKENVMKFLELHHVKKFDVSSNSFRY